MSEVGATSSVLRVFQCNQQPGLGVNYLGTGLESELVCDFA